jgi:hypothetical protein
MNNPIILKQQLKKPKTGPGIAYPVEFQDIKLMNNCICYTISSGNSQDGMNCKFL